MKLIPYAAAFVVCAVLVISYLAFPNVKVEERIVQLPPRPTLEQFRVAMLQVEAYETKVVLSGSGIPMRCKITDSTFEPLEAAMDYVYAVQWCVAITRSEYEAEKDRVQPSG